MAEQNITEIKDTDYITVKCDDKGQVDVFVGGKPATEYRGVKIWSRDFVIYSFQNIQKAYPNVEELRVLSSKTGGRFAEPGNPSREHGEHAWCCVKLKYQSSATPWIYRNCFSSRNDCAYYCAGYSEIALRDDKLFHWSVLGVAEKQVEKTQKTELQKLEQIDFSKLPKSPIELNGYEIVVRKISTHTK